MDERDFWLERRKALLTEVKAIEKRFPSSTVTLVLKRDEAERRGLCPDDKGVESAQKN